MQYREIEGKKVSRLIFGGVNQLLMKQRQKEANELLDAVLENGINSFDLARVYGMGKAEKTFGEWLKTKKRDEIVIETKCCHPDFIIHHPRVTKKCAKHDIEASLRDMKTDHVDFLLLHRDNPVIPAEEIVGFMNDLITEGKTLAIGVSNWEKERIEQANKYALAHSLKPFTVSSPQFSLAEEVDSYWMGHTVSLTGAKRAKDRAYYEANQMPVFAYSSLAGGFLSGKYHSQTAKKEIKSGFIKHAHFSNENLKRLVRIEQLAKEKNATVAQISLAWVLAQKMNTFSVLTFSSTKRVKENCSACDLILTEEEVAWLNLN